MKKFASFIAGIVVGMIIVSIPIFADSYARAIDAVVNFTTVMVDGRVVESDNLLIDDKTYVWIRDVANMFGKDIEWDEETNTANITDVVQTVATIDGAAITDRDIKLTSILFSGNTNYDSSMIESALDYKIESVLLLNAAEADGITLSDEEKEYAQANAALLLYPDYQDIKEMLERNNLLDAYLAFEQDNALLNNYITYLSDTATFPEEQMLAKFDEIKDDFIEMTAKHILILNEDRTDEEALAEIKRISALIKKPADFDKVMAEYSEDPGLADRPEGYTFFVGDMVQEFEQAALTQKIGVVGEPIKTAYGYHIVLVTERTEPVLADAEVRIRGMLFNSFLEQFMIDLKATSNIVINDEAVRNIK